MGEGLSWEGPMCSCLLTVAQHQRTFTGFDRSILLHRFLITVNLDRGSNNSSLQDAGVFKFCRDIVLQLFMPDFLLCILFPISKDQSLFDMSAVSFQSCSGVVERGGRRRVIFLLAVRRT